MVAFIGGSSIPGDDGKIYYSKYDGSYITRVGMEKSVKWLAKHEVTDCLTHGVGYSKKEHKWFGWSHRAAYGFDVGSTCKDGDCHYTEERGEWAAKTMDDARQMAIDFCKGVS